MSTVALSRSLASEVVRWRGSTAARLPLLAAGSGLVQLGLVLLSTAGPTWTAVFAHESLWVVLTGPLTIALLVGSTSRADRRARGGAIWWRPVDPLRARCSRFVVLAGLALAAHALVVTVPVALAGPLGAPGPVPVGRALSLVAVLWLSTLGMIAVLQRVGSRWGLLPVLAAGLVWAVVGTLSAESTRWPLVPFAWAVRGALPLVGTHANGMSLSPADVAAAASPWAPAALGALLAVPALLLPAPSRPGGRVPRTEARVPPHPRRDALRPPPSRTDRRTAAARRPHPLGAVAATLAADPVLRSAPLVALVPGTLLRWWPADESLEAYLLLALPPGSVVLAVVVWSTLAPGWRAVAARPPGPGPAAAAMGACAVGVTTATSLAVVTLHVAAGLPPAAWPPVALSAVATGALLTTAHLAVAVRLGVVATLALGVIGVMLGVLVGGSDLRAALWMVVPWASGVCVDPDQLLVTVPVASALTAASGWALVRAARRAAA